MTSALEITQEEIDGLQWFHEYDFADGKKARPKFRSHRNFHRAYEKFVCAQLEKIEFKGKSVVDIGCWDGFYSFYAKEQGAESVLAVDDYSQNWGTRRCFEIARQLKSCAVELLPDANVYSLSQKLHGQKFDVVMLLGVYYHLHAPYLALAQVRKLCHENSVVIIEGTCYRDDENPSARILLTEPHKSKFLPTSRLLDDMLQSCYLMPEVRAFISDFTAPDLLKHLPPDAVLDLLSEIKTGGGFFDSMHETQDGSESQSGSLSPRAIDRIVITAKPFVGKNELHFYQPPFGLSEFDAPERFAP